jgi:hypothetical protein
MRIGRDVKEKVLMPAVIGAGEFDQKLTARCSTGEAGGHIKHVGACIQKRRHFGAGNDARQRLAELELNLVWRAKDDAAGLDDVCDPRFYMLIDVTEDAGPGPIPVVDIAVAVGVPEVRPLRSSDEMGERRVVLSLALRSHGR